MVMGIRELKWERKGDLGIKRINSKANAGVFYS